MSKDVTYDLEQMIIDDELENYCPKCHSGNIANEGPPEDMTLELSCHECSYQWEIPFVEN